MLLETKAPVIVTGYTQTDMERDINWINKKVAGEFDILLEPGENTFRSLRWDLNDMDPQDISAGNWGVWAFRGKRFVLPKLRSSIPCANHPSFPDTRLPRREIQLACKPRPCWRVGIVGYPVHYTSVNEPTPLGIGNALCISLLFQTKFATMFIKAGNIS